MIAPPRNAKILPAENKPPHQPLRQGDRVAASDAQHQAMVSTVLLLLPVIPAPICHSREQTVSQL
jgi:hypothetical protein